MNEPTERDREIATKVVGLWKHTGDDLAEIVAYQLADERAKATAVMTPDTVACVPNTPGTPRRTIRVSDEEWQAAADAAEKRGENLSEEIRKFLRRYVRRNK